LAKISIWPRRSRYRDQLNNGLLGDEQVSSDRRSTILGEIVVVEAKLRQQVDWHNLTEAINSGHGRTNYPIFINCSPADEWFELGQPEAGTFPRQKCR
jgi:hypothetical protein